MTKTERIYIRLTPELKEQLQKSAEAEHRTVSNYIEYLVKRSLESEKT
jgi:hypothetical protein